MEARGVDKGTKKTGIHSSLGGGFWTFPGHQRDAVGLTELCETENTPV